MLHVHDGCVQPQIPAWDCKRAMNVTGGSRVFAHEGAQRQNLEQLPSRFSVHTTQASRMQTFCTIYNCNSEGDFSVVFCCCF